MFQKKVDFEIWNLANDIFLENIKYWMVSTGMTQKEDREINRTYKSTSVICTLIQESTLIRTYIQNLAKWGLSLRPLYAHNNLIQHVYYSFSYWYYSRVIYLPAEKMMALTHQNALNYLHTCPSKMIQPSINTWSI